MISFVDTTLRCPSAGDDCALDQGKEDGGGRTLTAQQVLPGTFEFALCHLVDNELDLSTLRSRYTNDAGGAPAFDPAVLLKIVLLAYSRGLISSRSIASACRNNVLFMAVSGDSAPHFTTIAGFVAELGDEAAALFTQVLLVCDRQGLIGRELFAIDGVKLPSNAAKAKSGTRADFEREAAKMEAAVQRMMGEQKARDLAGCDDEARAARTRERLTRRSNADPRLARRNPDERRGAKGAVRLSNRTDNESAKMATGKGVIQGYTGVAAVDAAHQIVVDAQAHGTGSEQELLLPVVDATTAQRTFSRNNASNPASSTAYWSRKRLRPESTRMQPLDAGCPSRCSSTGSVAWTCRRIVLTPPLPQPLMADTQPRSKIRMPARP
jgi:transposase